MAEFPLQTCRGKNGGKKATENPRASNPILTLAEVAAVIGKAQRAAEEGRLRYVRPKKGGHCEVLQETPK